MKSPRKEQRMVLMQLKRNLRKPNLHQDCQNLKSKKLGSPARESSTNKAENCSSVKSKIYINEEF
jgi:hypothetical protein